MIEENVVSAAGANNQADEAMLQFLISEAGFVPQQRDILYKHVNRNEKAELGWHKVLLCRNKDPVIGTLDRLKWRPVG